MLKILIAEDEEPIANLIRVNLKKAGYECICAYDGEEAANLMEEGHYDLLLLDIMLPKISGYELMEYAKTLSLPVIFITAMGTTNHKVTGLKMGAEDYITKPFEIVELLARVEAVLRRYHKIGKIIKVLDVEIDLSSRIVLQNGQQVLLTLKEYELLLFFVRNPNIALYREVIYEQVWEKEYTGDSRTVDLHVQRLKKKLGWEGHICAIYKIGYRLETSL
ncbi:MAG: response regulator transcription factor [Lachnospiraceae bacterium]|jgi:two-component system alkaline phosphatase synthesis response regulator PhoP|nr:response regulator transcription factor [Lachnospiraceae bacterium]